MNIPAISKSIASAAFLLCAALPAAQAQGPRQPDMVIDAKERQLVIDTMLTELQRGYVFPDQAAKIAVAIRQRQKAGQYNGITSAEQFAATLTEHMRTVTGDKHLMLGYSAEAIPEAARDSKPSAAQLADDLAAMKSMNFGLERVERLPFNIGYLGLNAFAPAKEAGATLAAGMTLLSHVDTLIIDLRKNGGGDPATVAMLASYLFDERTRLNDIYYREGDRTEQMWTSDFVAGARFGQQKKVYILTSKDTFSAAEDFSYAMKNLKRAVIVGETTGGGAHPGDTVRIDAHFGMNVPNGRSISPVTKTDWEGTGVTPDVAVPAGDALRTAQVAALQAMLQTEKNPGKAERIRARIAAVDKAPEPVLK